jgi:hypothetical protein
MTTRSWIWVLAACFVWTGFVSRAAAGGSTIANAMGDLRWGMTESEVISYVKRKLGEQYAAKISKASGSQQSKLKDELKQAQAEVAKSRVEFEGSRSRWDSSPVAGEFTYGDDESMLTAKGDGGSQSFYFFRDGRLWKWYKALDQAQFGGSSGFKKFSGSIEGSFGKGRAKKGELNPNQGETQWVEYLDRTSRLRAADNTKRGVFALIFEDMSVVRELASLRPTKPSRLAGQDDEDAPPPAKDNVKTGDSAIARAQTKRSVFASEPQQESEADFQSRKQKTANEARERQVREHVRKQDAKQGEVLKTLDGIDDKDPLGGL